MESSSNSNLKKNEDNNCNHNFIVDYIDITPEKSERIIYCTKCEMCSESLPKRNISK